MVSTENANGRFSKNKMLRRLKGKKGDKLKYQVGICSIGFMLMYAWSMFMHPGGVSMMTEHGHGRSLLEASSEDGRNPFCPTLAPKATAAPTTSTGAPTTSTGAPTTSPPPPGRRLMSSGIQIPDAFGLPEKKAENGYLVFLHFFGMLYMFVGLALVCDEFFETSLEKIAEWGGLSEDVAGATLMAMGSSAPELFTSLMGAFAAESDVGVGTIVGSAVFNVLIIIGLCSIVAAGVSIDWWPLTRDSAYYCVSIIALVICIVDGEARWYEGLICVSLYVGYIVLMKFNEPLGDYVRKGTADAKARGVNYPKGQAFVESMFFQVFILLVILANLAIIVIELVWVGAKDFPLIVVLNYVCAGIFILEFLIKIVIYSFYNYWRDPDNAFDGVLVGLILFEFVITAVSASVQGGDSTGTSKMGGIRSLRAVRFMRAIRMVRVGKIATTARKIKKTAIAAADGDGIVDEETANAAANKEEEVAMTSTKGGDEEKGEAKEGEGGEGGGDDDDEDDEPFNPFEAPEGVGSKIWWLFTLPLCVMIFFTVPDGRRERFSKSPWFFVTFGMSIFWIAVLSYFMVLWAEIAGDTIGIPSAVMGLTILAAGTSVPDTMASVGVARKGQGSAAVANSLGSNVFDILIGLGLPWLLKEPITGKRINITSDSLVISILILYITVGFVVLAIHYEDFILTKRIGYMLVVGYLAYVTLALLMEFIPDAFTLCD